MIWRLGMRFRKLLCRPQTRIDLLFTMSDITHAAVHPDNACELMFRGQLFEALSIFNSIWWSQTGSNRRPHACKARALPAELWPRTRRRRPSSPFGLCRARFTRSSCVAAPRVANGEAWWAWEDLNFRPHAYQARALTN